ncbi:MAG: hypothetical protein Q9157_000172 [Trypethelium eluteriae]
MGIWDSSKGKDFDDEEEDCNHLVDRGVDKRQDKKGSAVTVGVEAIPVGGIETTVEGRPGAGWGKDRYEDVELGEMKSFKGKVHVRTDVSVTEVREDHI